MVGFRGGLGAPLRVGEPEFDPALRGGRKVGRICREIEFVRFGKRAVGIRLFRLRLDRFVIRRRGGKGVEGEPQTQGKEHWRFHSYLPVRRSAFKNAPRSRTWRGD